MPRRELKGTVVSSKGAKTVVVKVLRKFKHPLYKKVMTRSKNYMAHDESDQHNVGDDVVIQECRPISKHKTWSVVKAQN